MSLMARRSPRAPLFVMLAVLGAGLFPTQTCAAPNDAAPAGNMLKPLKDAQAWYFFKVGGEATIQRQPDSVMIDVTRAGDQRWNIQLQSSVEPHEGRQYTLRFRAKADTSRPLGIVGAVNVPDYHMIGLLQNVDLTTDAQDFSFTFTAEKLLPGHDSVPQFQMGDRAGKVWISHISLVPTDPDPAAATPSGGNALTPRTGEVRLEGTVREASPAQKRLVLWVSRATDPGRPPHDIEPPRQKIVVIRPSTHLLSPSGGRAALGDFQPGDAVVIVGKSLGVGKPMAARLIAAGS